MNFDYKVLDSAERITYALRSLYGSHGYSQYKMSKFEEYDLYSRNKDFLVSDSIITFTDTNGKLMALKPDVTLSIIKNCGDLKGSVQKLCYNENVYRVSKGTGSFKELMQVGLECIGEVDSFCIGEVLWLAAESLETVSEEFVLDISSLDLLSAFIDSIADSDDMRQKIMNCAGKKNTHGITEICKENGIDELKAEPLKELIMTYGTIGEALPKIERLAKTVGAETAFASLKTALSIFEGYSFADNIHIDMSVVSDMKYYNGIVFNGFINSVPDSVLSGGQYDRLMSKLKNKASAIGFAVYLDLLENIGTAGEDADVDIMLLYDKGTAPSELRRLTSKLIGEGKKVFAAEKADKSIKYRQLWEFKNGEVKILEYNA